MTDTQSMFGDISQLATALGVVDGNEVSPEFFANPAHKMGQMLRDQSQRQALLDFVDQALGDQAPQVTDEDATWTPLAKLNDSFSLYLTTSTVSEGTVFGIGARGVTSQSDLADGRVNFPLFLVPPTSAPVVFLPGSSSAHAVATLSVLIKVSSDVLGSAGLTLDIPMGSGANADFAVNIKGLTLPGSAPLDLTFGSQGGGQTVENELAQAVAAMLKDQLAAAESSLPPEGVALLNLFGLGPNPPIELPVLQVATGGLPALQEWLSSLAANQSAMAAWVEQAAKLTGLPTSAGTLPTEVSVALTTGVSLTLSLNATPDAAGGATLAPALELVAEIPGVSGASLEMSATLLEVSVGPHPTITALPSLSCTAHYTGSPNLLSTTLSDVEVVVGGLRAGISLDASRHVVFVLAAEAVDIGAPGATNHHDVLDLTSPDALADVGGEALSGVMAGLFQHFGQFGSAAGELLGLVPPANRPAGWPSINPATLFADPVGAVTAYHRDVIALGSTAYAQLLESVGSLAGFTVSVPGTGTFGDPWVVLGGGEAELVVWKDTASPPAVHVGGRCKPAAAAIGGPQGPSLSFGLVMDALAITLPPAGTQNPPLATSFSALSSVSLTATVATTPPATPFVVSVGPATLTFAGIELTCEWTPGTGLKATLAPPDASIAIAGNSTALILPTMQDGELVLPAGLSDSVAEALLAAAMSTATNEWLHTLPSALGLTETVTSPAAFKDLLVDPLGWFTQRLRARLLADANGTMRALMTSVAALPGSVSSAASSSGVSASSAAAPTVHAADGATSLPTSVPFKGSGTPDDPYTVQLLNDGALELSATAWLDPAGPPIPAATLASLFQPAVLSSWLSGAGAALSSSDLTGILNAASAVNADLAGILQGRDSIASGFDSLVARCVGGDGLLPGGADNVAGASPVQLVDVANADLPKSLDLASLGVPAASVILYITGPYVPPWPDSTLETIDLTTPGIAATAFDVSAVAGTAKNWHVRLPSIADCPGGDAATQTKAQSDRLARVVNAAATGGRPVLLVAHGAAGNAARAVAAPGSSVAGLVLLGAPASSVPLDILDAPPVADALALLRSLLPAPGSQPDSADLARARSVFGLLTELFNAPSDPNLDLAPPSSLAAPTVPTWSLRGNLSAADMTRAVGAVVAAALAQRNVSSVSTPTALRYGLEVGRKWTAASSAGDPSGVSVDVSCRIDLPGLLFASGSLSPLHVRLDVDIYREGGWLAGGPQGASPTPGVLRTPALRRASLTLWLGLGGTTSQHETRITLVDGTALGSTQDQWVLDATSALSAEARVLLARLASALDPVPATGPVAAVVDLLNAAGLADPQSSGFNFSVDALQRILLDPTNALKDAFTQQSARVAAAGALRALLGDTNGTGGTIALTVADMTIGADLAAVPPAVTVGTVPAGMTIAGNWTVNGSVQVNAAGAVTGSITVGAGGQQQAFGVPTLELQLGSPVSLALVFGNPPSGFPGRVPLFPTPSTGQLEGAGQLALEAVEAAAIKAIIQIVRARLNSSVRALVDPVLTGIGLLTGTGSDASVALPFGLLTDPAGWALRTLAVGEQLQPERAALLVDDLRAAFGITTGSHGDFPITSSVSASVGSAPTGGLLVGLKCSPTGLPLSLAIDLGLTLNYGSAPVPALEANIGPSGTNAALNVALNGKQLSASLLGAGIDLPLLPTCGGLGTLAGAAAQQALPLVLNALETSTIPVIPGLLTATRTTLGLGNSAFDGAQLQMLAANPASELARRLEAAGGAAVGNLGQQMLPSLPAPWAFSKTTTGFKLSYGSQSIALMLGGSPTSVSVEVSLAASTTNPEFDVAVDATVDTTGLRSLKASAGLSPADALTVGPLRLAPFLDVKVGPDVAPAQVGVGLAWSGSSEGTGPTAMLSVELAPLNAALQTRDGGSPSDAVAALVSELLVPAAAQLAMAQSAVTDLLKTQVGTVTIGGLLTGVLLVAPIPPSTVPSFDSTLLDVSTLPRRVGALISNLSELAPIPIVENLTFTLAAEPSVSNPSTTLYGLTVSVAPGQRAELVSGDVSLGLEAADDWVATPKLDGPGGKPGLSIFFLTSTGAVPPVIVVEGLGLRLYRQSGPLLDTGLQIGSVALYSLLRVDAGSGGVTDGGVAIELADLAIAIASASGGDNSVAQGILGNANQSGSGGDSTALKPAFSSRLALQMRQGDPTLQWSLTAGDGKGPWILPIDKSFGPLRVDDVGFGVDQTGTEVTAVRVLISGGVSLLGLALDVTDLSVGAPWPASSTGGGSGNPSLTNAAAWSIDLSGLDVSYSGGGVSLAGGLRRRDNPSIPGNPPDYVGMLVAQVGPYGLTAFGGYGQFPSPSGTFTALFVFAAINAPIGGPPAFFVTGLAGGVGINRALVLPTTLDDLSTFPLVAALDPDSGLAADPEQAMNLLSTSFPPQHGTFWFAAGLSFTSFSLVDVVAVLGVEVGSGLMVTLLGLATAALPNPDFPLAQLQLALMAEFSTADGVLLIQAQLTDQSYLLDPDCRLTGGFAYASWFGSNPNAGQFVVSIGGYHPDFHHDGYPVVPRVGYVWNVLDCLTISGQSYFAITSEALMAGTNFTAALTLGPAWASLTLGVDAIIYFDPFKFSAHGYASIAAGITISVDLLFGTVTVSLSFHLGADVLVEGPSIHGTATIDLDVTSVTVAFGTPDDHSTTPLGWTDFRRKYLTAADTKAVLSASPGSGLITNSGTPAPDGSASNPWLVLPEFTMTFATAAPATTAWTQKSTTDTFPPAAGIGVQQNFPLSGTIGIAPMLVGAMDSLLGIVITSSNQFVLPVFADPPGPFLSLALTTAPMPKGIWAPQLPSGTIPTGDTVTAGSGLLLTACADVSVGTPAVQYNQIDVEADARKPLPFAVERAARTALAPDATIASAFVGTMPTTASTVVLQAQSFLSSGPNGSAQNPYAAASFARNRVAPPLLELLTTGIAPTDAPTPPVLTPVPRLVPPVIDTSIQAPILTAYMTSGPAPTPRPVIRTSFTPAAGSPAVARFLAPGVASLSAATDPAIGGNLVRTAPTPSVSIQGLQASDGIGSAQRAGTGTELLRGAGPDPSGSNSALDALQQALLGSGALVRPGDLWVLTLPNQERDIDTSAQRPTLSVTGDAATRVVALSGTGEVLTDTTTPGGTTGETITIPQYTALIALMCTGGSGAIPAGLAGWTASDRLPYVGSGVSLASRAVVTGLAAPDRSFRSASAATANAAGPAASASAVRTWLPSDTSTVVVSIDATEGADISALALGLTGAIRVPAADGGEQAPTVVTAGGRAHLLYAIEPDPAFSAGGDIEVSVVTGNTWRLAGVLGGTADVAVTATAIASQGASAVVAPMVQASTGNATVRWVAPTSPPPPGPSRPQGGSS